MVDELKEQVLVLLNHCTGPPTGSRVQNVERVEYVLLTAHLSTMHLINDHTADYDQNVKRFPGYPFLIIESIPWYLLCYFLGGFRYRC
jgi:hypothetical protein